MIKHWMFSCSAMMVITVFSSSCALCRPKVTAWQPQIDINPSLSVVQPAQVVVEPEAEPVPPVYDVPVSLPPPVREPIPIPIPIPIQGTAEDMLPPNAKPGECYARVFIPPEYKSVTEEVLIQEESEQVEIIPAEYNWVEEEILVQEASEELEIIPAQYEWFDTEVLVKPASTEVIEVPAEYEWVDEQVLVKSAHTVWKKGRGLVEKVNGATGEIMCLIEVPAQYKALRKQVLASPATTSTQTIPAEYRSVRKRVMTQAPSTRTKTIPARYETVRVKKMIRPEQERHIPIPARYQTVEKQVMSTEGGMAWHRVLCETNLGQELISQIQSTLRDLGYDPGPVDGVIGIQTNIAIEKYQRGHGLAVGGLTIETIHELGITL